MTTLTFVLPLSFTTPPLSLNKHMHYMQRAKIVRELRHEVVVRLGSQQVPRPAAHVSAQFHWRPKHNRVRDTDNLAPTIKPLIDALTPETPARVRGKRLMQAIPGYGLVPDDAPQYVTRPEAVIHPASSTSPRCWMELTITYEETEQ